MDRFLVKNSQNYKKYFLPFLSNELSLESELGSFIVQKKAHFLALRDGMNAMFNDGSFSFEDVYHPSPDGHPGSKGYLLYATLIDEFLQGNHLIPVRDKE